MTCYIVIAFHTLSSSNTYIKKRELNVEAMRIYVISVLLVTLTKFEMD